ncbi:hypothetical protein CAPTEDRAFT_118913 [Capitella teleta]|uniref:Metalloendopeptidase n=1 Tax=Capitella teleta TaxID=283909 RepID=R7UAB8_CAPTE|nr:hypothetical protein CAPTEDRAFT_118913 [Capitella teleta]|eukprot:ELU00758.1 hypothetical protein CAPTEDRAFT_118913 [Capitella teleta]
MSGAQPISPCAGVSLYSYKHWSCLGNKNIFSLYKSGIGTPLHEILHALAGRHEQSRTDRDEWIQILYNNIQDGLPSNFEAGSDGTDNRVPYDFGSIMQYSLGVSMMSEDT